MTKKTQKKMRKALLLLACAALLVCITVGVTVAYLIDDDSVTNTFTVGNIQMIMDETDTDSSNTNPAVANTGRDRQNTYDHVKPNDEFTKDPIIWLDKDSEKAYVFVEVTNEIAGIEADTADKDTIAEQIDANGWDLLEPGVYYKTVDASTMTAATEAGYTDYIKLPVFEKVYISADVDNATLQTYNNKTVVVNAYAIQYAGFENDVAGAWTEVKTASND